MRSWTRVSWGLLPIVVAACSATSAGESAASKSSAVDLCPAGTVKKLTSTGYTCVHTAYAVEGTVTGLTGAGLRLINRGTVARIDQNGPATFTMPGGECYDVFVDQQPTGQACSVTNGFGCAAGRPFEVTCGRAFTVGGTVTGLEGNTTAQTGLSLSLQVTDAVVPPQPLLANGTYVLATPLADGQSYTVFVSTQPPGQTCTVANGTGTIARASVAHVNVSCATQSPTWARLAHAAPTEASAMWLMQDGAVLVLARGGRGLWRLTPSSAGSYVDGTWSSAGELPVATGAFISQVLSNGRLVACGGEPGGPGTSEMETSSCAIYDPATRLTLPLSPPAGWLATDDSRSTVLPDGSMLVGNPHGLGGRAAILNPVTLTWSFVVGHDDDEQGYALLQTGDVFTANARSASSLRYSPGSSGFVADAALPSVLGVSTQDSAAPRGASGPWMTLMNGQVIWFGASGRSAVYTPTRSGENGGWGKGPEPPPGDGTLLGAVDGPALLEPTGRVLLLAGQGAEETFAEYSPFTSTLAVVPNAPMGSSASLLALPTGEALVSSGSGAWYDVTFPGVVGPSPTITSFPSSLARGTTVALFGTQLCGLSEVSTDRHAHSHAEDYPLVRVSRGSFVRYLRAHDVSTRSIAPGQPGSVLIDVPSTLAPGSYAVEVIAMGIASPPVTVRVQ